jgi:hypothetical protein
MAGPRSPKDNWDRPVFGQPPPRKWVQDVVFKLGETAIEFPPMQRPASFNLAAVKEKIEAAIRAHEGGR